jgi:hypothetical protein
MSRESELAAALELRRLHDAYAAALDGNDPEGLLAVFSEDARLRMFDPGATEPSAEVVGHDQLVYMPTVMAERYAKTMHVITNSSSKVDGDQATGDAYCVAHHMIEGDAGPYKVVIYLRYHDEFTWGTDARWRISSRDIVFLWAEEVAVLAWPVAQQRARLT